MKTLVLAQPVPGRRAEDYFDRASEEETLVFSEQLDTGCVVMVRLKEPECVQLEMSDLPEMLREWIDIFYPGEDGIAWFRENNKVFDGQSPQKMLSVRYDLSPAELRENVGRIVAGFRDALSYVSAPYVAPSDAVYSEIVAAQRAVLERVLRPRKKRHDRTPSPPQALEAG